MQIEGKKVGPPFAPAEGTQGFPHHFGQMGRIDGRTVTHNQMGRDRVSLINLAHQFLAQLPVEPTARVVDVGHRLAGPVHQHLPLLGLVSGQFPLQIVLQGRIVAIKGNAADNRDSHHGHGHDANADGRNEPFSCWGLFRHSPPKPYYPTPGSVEGMPISTTPADDRFP